jgi:hypothetical protein
MGTPRLSCHARSSAEVRIGSSFAIPIDAYGE